jgi:hypothetical protein
MPNKITARKNGKARMPGHLSARANKGTLDELGQDKRI